MEGYAPCALPSDESTTEVGTASFKPDSGDQIAMCSLHPRVTGIPTWNPEADDIALIHIAPDFTMIPGRICSPGSGAVGSAEKQLKRGCVTGNNGTLSCHRFYFRILIELFRRCFRHFGWHWTKQKNTCALLRCAASVKRVQRKFGSLN